MEPLVAAENLRKHYKDVVALNGVSFGISDGITGILGENGAGKSTAIKIFLGLLQPTSGSAIVFGEDASKSVAVRSKLGYMRISAHREGRTRSADACSSNENGDENEAERERGSIHRVPRRPLSHQVGAELGGHGSPPWSASAESGHLTLPRGTARDGPRVGGVRVESGLPS